MSLEIAEKRFAVRELRAALVERLELGGESLAKRAERGLALPPIDRDEAGRIAAVAEKLRPDVARGLPE